MHDWMPTPTDWIAANLNGTWRLRFGPERGGRQERLTPHEIPSSWTDIPAQVPGNVEIDLVAARLEADPFFGENQLLFAKYESYQWYFTRHFEVPAITSDERLLLRFEGLDTYADIYVNGRLAGSAGNMFIRQDFDISALIHLGEPNELGVHIHSAVNVARRHEYPMFMRGTGHRNEICHLRKAPHMFGWDIAPRLVSAGIWRDVLLVRQPLERIVETYYAVSELTTAGARLQIGCRYTTPADRVDLYRLRLSGRCGDHSFATEFAAPFVSMNETVLIPNPKLWWPRGYGSAHLYEVTLELIRDGMVVDTRTERIGLRTVRLERCFTPGAQRFQYYVNDVPVFLRGTNWVPLDALHSRDASRLERALDLLAGVFCNAVRCWGGNVYEDHAFFDRCDAEGILVWQDFAMGNSNYPQAPGPFWDALSLEAAAVIRKLRNHPSLLIWSGDNEITFKNTGYHYPTPASLRNRVAEELLPRLVQEHDPYRFFLISSPEIPPGFHTDNVPEQHTWGARAWYKDDFYKHSSASFIAEAGYHGCPDPASLRQFLAPEDVWPLDNKASAIHSTEDVRIEPELNIRNRLMADQVRILAGTVPEDLETFAEISQLSQAEALKFFVERTRALKWQRSGILWWNLLDCWPQISDAIVDYYWRPKMAYDVMRRVQKPVLVFVGEADHWEHPLYAANDTREPVSLRCTVSDADSGTQLYAGSVSLAGGETQAFARLRLIPGERRLLLIRWEQDASGESGENHYLTGFPAYDPEDLLRWAAVIRKLR